MNRIKVLLVCGPGETGDKILSSLSGYPDVEITCRVPDVATAASAEKHDIILVEGNPDADSIAGFVSSRGMDSGIILFAEEQQKSMVAESIIRSLETGAFDYAVLPSCQTAILTLEVWGRRLATKIRIASTKIYSRAARSMAGGSKIEQPSSKEGMQAQVLAASSNLVGNPENFSLIAIGASTGGPEALLKMLPMLPKGLPVPVLIVLHMPRDFTASMADNLDKKCSFRVTEALDKEILKPGCAYLAPGDLHMTVGRGAGSNLLVRLEDGPAIFECRPSVDVLFASAAKACPGKVIGVILTGMGCDGSAGAGKIKETGGIMLAQDKASSLIWGMPGSAHGAGNVHALIPLLEIPLTIVEILTASEHNWPEAARR